MRNILAYSLIAMSVTAVTPAMAQGVYLGPNGVGVGTGYGYNRGYDRDRGDTYRGRRSYEGRSIYRDGHLRNDRDRDR